MFKYMNPFLNVSVSKIVYHYFIYGIIKIVNEGFRWFVGTEPKNYYP